MVEEIETRYQSNQIDIILLLKKMLSYKTLMVIFLLIGISASLVWGLVLYEPSYDMSASFSYVISTSSTLSSMYGVNYLTPENLVVMMNHRDTVTEYLQTNIIDESKITAERFLKPFNVQYDKGIISVNVRRINEQSVALYKDYVTYCINNFNKENQDKVIAQLESAKNSISEELRTVEEKVFSTDMVNASNYSYSITLKDRIKSIDIQIDEIKEGTVRGFCDYEAIKVSSRAKNMIIIVIVVLLVGAWGVFLICYIDTRIYYSEDITDIPLLEKKLLSCIPLYKDDRISEKEGIYIKSKLPDDVTSISVSEISDYSGAIEISNVLNKLSHEIRVEYSGCLYSDADIISDFSEYSINLIILRAGIDTVNQVRNIVRDCKIKCVDNYYLVLYGLEPSDKRVTLFEDKSHYIKYPILSPITLRQHYRKYYELKA